MREMRSEDDLGAPGNTGAEIAAKLEVSGDAAQLARTYGGMGIDAAGQLKELREQNAKLKRAVGRRVVGEGCVREVGKTLLDMSNVQVGVISATGVKDLAGQVALLAAADFGHG